MQNQQTTSSVIDYSNLSDWKTLDEVEQLYPHFKKTTLRWLLRNKHRNGLDQVVKKIGKFNYVHIPSFSIWISNR